MTREIGSSDWGVGIAELLRDCAVIEMKRRKHRAIDDKNFIRMILDVENYSVVNLVVLKVWIVEKGTTILSLDTFQ